MQRNPAPAVAFFFIYAILAVFAMLGSGCAGRTPPEVFSIGEGFNEGERETIRAAVDSWCAAAGWCPEEVFWAERGHFELTDSIERQARSADGRVGTVAGRNMDDSRIVVARDRPQPENLELLWIVVAHEIGHFCFDDHTDSGLMADFHVPGASLSVDEKAVAAWREGCN